jgi:hypothetical protein
MLCFGPGLGEVRSARQRMRPQTRRSRDPCAGHHRVGTTSAAAAACIGRPTASANPPADGIWPCRCIREGEGMAPGKILELKT